MTPATGRDAPGVHSVPPHSNAALWMKSAFLTIVVGPALCGVAFGAALFGPALVVGLVASYLFLHFLRGLEGPRT